MAKRASGKHRRGSNSNMTLNRTPKGKAKNKEYQERTRASSADKNKGKNIVNEERSKRAGQEDDGAIRLRTCLLQCSNHSFALLDESSGTWPGRRYLQK